MEPEASDRAASGRGSAARTKLVVALAAAIVSGTAAAAVGAARAAPLIGWDVLAVVFCGWVWATIWRLDAPSTERHANRENPGQDLADGPVLADVVSLDHPVSLDQPQPYILTDDDEDAWF